MLPCAFACGADVAMTLVGQPAAYWAGNRAAAQDFNPLARGLLEVHPAAFPLAAAVGLVVLAVVFHIRPGARFAIVIAFVVTFAQSVAAAGWLIRYGPLGWVGALLVLLIAERLWTLATRPAAKAP